MLPVCEWCGLRHLCPVLCAGAAVLSGSIYVLGGEEGWDMYHKSVERYNVAADRWEDASEMATPRSWLTCSGLQVRPGHRSRRVGRGRPGHRSRRVGRG